MELGRRDAGWTMRISAAAPATGTKNAGVMCQPCGGIDTCEETRYIEAFATWGAALVILLTPIAMVAGFVLLIVATVKGWI